MRFDAETFPDPHFFFHFPDGTVRGADHEGQRGPRWLCRAPTRPFRAPEPVQDVPPEPMPVREARTVEVVGRVARHPEPLHHRPGSHVLGAVNNTISGSLSSRTQT